MPGLVPVEASLVGQTNSVFMGTSVRAGTARVLIVQTGAGTVYGQLAQRLTLRPPETEFERGIRHFGYLLTQLMLALTLIILTAKAIPYLPFVTALGFVPLPWPIMALLIAITLLYVATAEVVKHYFYRHASGVL